MNTVSSDINKVEGNPVINSRESAQVVVELRNVTKKFGEVVAVNDVSLRIYEGEFFSLLGPSGCGKTTTLRIIGGLEFPDIGNVYIDGQSVTDVPANERDTNMVFQQLALFPHLDVYDNVAFGPKLHRIEKSEIKKRVREILRLVELSGFETRRIHQLSGGQQQRVAIARALINEPAVLLLDEPLGALDLKLRLQMQLELKSIQERIGTTFIYVTHDQGEALTMSDRIAVMNKGRIEQIGASEEVYLSPTTKFVANFIGDTNLIQGQIVGKDNNDFIVEVQGIRVLVSMEGWIFEENVYISLRPEMIKIGENLPKTQLPNIFKGRVLNTTFVGSQLVYEIILDNGLKLKAESLSDTSKIWHPGDLIEAGWSKESCTLIKE